MTAAPPPLTPGTRVVIHAPGRYAGRAATVQCIHAATGWAFVAVDSAPGELATVVLFAPETLEQGEEREVGV